MPDLLPTSARFADRAKQLYEHAAELGNREAEKRLRQMETAVRVNRAKSE